MDQPTRRPLQVYTVSQLTSRIRDCIQRDFRNVIVEGEISNCKLYPSGHLYFTLKDDFSSLKAVMFNCLDKYAEGVIKDGTAVICKGRIDVYAKRGEYRLLADEIEVKGFGLLQMKFERLKEKLAKEGLFDGARKKSLPFLPERIGMVTSPVGAAIRDMLKILSEKFENLSVLIYPVRVQGEEASREVTEGIRYFNREKNVDVIIVGRGGGSLEDLACFNEEEVARAIAASTIPIISGVGHEIDFTIADFVADVRAPTPTAAADMVVRDKRELQGLVAGLEENLKKMMRKRMEQSRFLLFRRTTELRDKRDFIVRQRFYLDELLGGLMQAASRHIREKRVRLEGVHQRLNDLNPETILKRGYSITVRKATGEVVKDSSRPALAEEVLVRLARGSLDCIIQKKILPGGRSRS